MTATRHGPIPRFATGKVRAIEPSDFRVLGEIPSQALSFTIYRAGDRARDQRPRPQATRLAARAFVHDLRCAVNCERRCLAPYFTRATIFIARSDGCIVALPMPTERARTIIAMAGLPGAGKSTLGGALARALDAPILCKDEIRRELFGRDRIEYSREQDDACCRAMHERAEQFFARGASVVVLDGRTYSKRHQVLELETMAERAAARLALIECTATVEVVRARLEHDARVGAHPAKNRDFALYLALRESAEPIEREKLVIDTSGGALDEQLSRCLAWLEPFMPSNG
jgi:predicted kinase